MDVLSKRMNVWTPRFTTRETLNTSGLLCLRCWMKMLTASPQQQGFFFFFALGQTVAPPAMFGGKYHLTPHAPSTKFWNESSVLRYHGSTAEPQREQGNSRASVNRSSTLPDPLSCLIPLQMCLQHSNEVTFLKRGCKFRIELIQILLYDNIHNGTVKCTWFRWI